jgi:hypothetical protein
MYLGTVEHSETVPLSAQQGYSHVQVVAAVARPDTAQRLALLSEAGFSRERIEVVIVEEVPRLEELLGGTGLHRFLVRLRLLRGDDLDELEQARRVLMNGHALIQVLACDDEEQHRARTILNQHGSRNPHHVAVWTIRSPAEW